jgi:hypothetical protein
LHPRKQGPSVGETTTGRANLEIQIDKRSTFEDLLGFVQRLTAGPPSCWDLLAIVRVIQRYLETSLRRFPSLTPWDRKKLCLIVFEVLLQFEFIRRSAFSDELLGDLPDLIEDNEPGPRKTRDVTVEIQR